MQTNNKNNAKAVNFC